MKLYTLSLSFLFLLVHTDMAMEGLWCRAQLSRKITKKRPRSHPLSQEAVSSVYWLARKKRKVEEDASEIMVSADNEHPECMALKRDIQLSKIVLMLETAGDDLEVGHVVPSNTQKDHKHHLVAAQSTNDFEILLKASLFKEFLKAVLHESDQELDRAILKGNMREVLSLLALRDFGKKDLNLAVSIALKYNQRDIIAVLHPFFLCKTLSAEEHAEAPIIVD